jgi:hypothetical protein
MVTRHMAFGIMVTRLTVTRLTVTRPALEDGEEGPAVLALVLLVPLVRVDGNLRSHLPARQ